MFALRATEPCAVPLALLQGERTLRVLRATPTPTGGVPPQLALPLVSGRDRSVAGRLTAAECSASGAGASPSQDIGATNRRRIGLGKLLRLRFGQLPVHIFDSTA